MLTRQPPPPDFEWTAESIRALRTHLGQSQAALSRELGIRQQTVSEWETGMYRPRGASITILTLLAVSSGFQFDAAAQPPRRHAPFDPGYLTARDQGPANSSRLGPHERHVEGRFQHQELRARRPQPRLSRRRDPALAPAGEFVDTTPCPALAFGATEFQRCWLDSPPTGSGRYL